MNHRILRQVAVWLLECLLPEEDRDAVIGDLIEESALRARTSTRASVTWWCWGQVARSISRVLWSGLRRGNWLRTLGVASAVYVAASALEALSVGLLSRLLLPHSPVTTVLNAIVGLATMVLGGYVADSIRQGAAPALAAVILIVVLLLFVTMSSTSAPLWYGLTFLIAGPLAALTGGRLSVARRIRRAT